MIYGYARVSTTNQNLEAQIEQLNNYGVDEVFFEKVVGTHPQKIKLNSLLAQLKKNDTLVVTRMDRLGRNTIQLLGLVDELNIREVNLVVINMGIDTRTDTGKFFLTVMAGFSELDRNMIKEKQRLGIENAKKKGIYKGRPPKYTLANPKVKHALELRVNTSKTIKEISRITDISEATLYRIYNKHLNKERI